jgi:phosphatidylethanolamine/phosphatidyl-N-methylethanolamine N-methyltransferase
MVPVLRTLTFFKSFITKPGDVGAVLPSSDELADLVTDEGRIREANVVVEFGAGTGAITKWVLKKKRPDAAFFALEINPEFVSILRQRFPDVHILNDSAVNTRHYLAEFGHNGCDVVVSGLPWSTFKDELQDELIEAVRQSLKPGGCFVTYSYLTSRLTPGGMRFRKLMYEKFRNVRRTRMVWMNVPPAFVYYGEL